VLAFQGQEVIRQNHIGDWGLQMGMVTYALEQEGAKADELKLDDLLRMYRDINEASKEPTMRRQMAARTRELQQTPKEHLHGWKKVRELTLSSAQSIYQRLGVLLSPEDVRGESFYSDRYAPLVEELKRQGQAKETEGAIGLF